MTTEANGQPLVLKELFGYKRLHTEYRRNGAALECWSWSTSYRPDGTLVSKTEPELLSSIPNYWDVFDPPAFLILAYSVKRRAAKKGR